MYPLVAQQKSEKRGVAYGHHEPSDLAVLSPGVLWWYNWYHQPEAAVVSVYSNYNLDYVPMAWNGSFNKEAMRTFLSTHPNVKYLLGWNEPNFTTQANMTPKQAAAEWHHLEELAEEFNLKLVSPAVNYCDQCVSEDGTTYTDPVKYLDAFFEACTDCQVDYIAIHSYMGNVSALQWFVGLFKKYDKPIWLTEFANWENNPTLQDQKSFMIGAVDYLENDPDVYRYAWFTGRHTGAPYIGLLSTTQLGTLTELGSIYVNMPLHDENNFIMLPATIQAENYNKMNGILLEQTTDVNGFANVGYMDAGDWLEYGVESAEGKLYPLSLRVAGTSTGTLQIKIDNAPYKTISIPPTGGWQTWTTLKDEIQIPAGKHSIQLYVINAGFNINWFSLIDEPILDTEENLKCLKIYPNPTNSQLKVETSHVIQSLNLTDVVGTRRISLPVTTNNTIDLSHLPSGVYLLSIKTNSGSITKKLVKH